LAYSLEDCGVEALLELDWKSWLREASAAHCERWKERRCAPPAGDGDGALIVRMVCRKSAKAGSRDANEVQTTVLEEALVFRERLASTSHYRQSSVAHDGASSPRCRKDW